MKAGKKREGIIVIQEPHRHPRGMSCKRLLSALSDYIEGDIDPAMCRTLREHLRECNPCRIVLDTTTKTIRFYRENLPCELPRGLERKLQTAIKARWRSRQKQGSRQKGGSVRSESK
jgi:predicted anti-sigma-YlaC factor YlaD